MGFPLASLSWVRGAIALGLLRKQLESDTDLSKVCLFLCVCVLFFFRHRPLSGALSFPCYVLASRLPLLELFLWQEPWTLL